MFCREPVDEVPLERVRVLILVHQDELKPALVKVPQVGELLQHAPPLRQQVIEIHPVRRLLAREVTRLDVRNLLRQRREVVVILRQRLRERPPRVHRHREDVPQHVRLREPRLLHVNARFVDARLQQILRVL